jgi:hypothetical protein
MSNRPSSAGERAAVIGYSAQYQIAAEVIYAALEAGQLEWIALADPEAGRVDDIQLVTSGRIDAYQVKWGEQIEEISFNDLTTGKGDTTLTSSQGLIGQLAGGWQKLKLTNPTYRVVVHLATRHIASASEKAKIPHDNGILSKPNLQGFITDCWMDRHWSQEGLSACPSGWSPALLALRTASGLNDESFVAFVQDCEFEFGYQISRPHGTRQGNRKLEDIRILTEFLLNTVGADKRVIHIKCQELLHRLGWSERFTPRFAHEFKVTDLYQPITETVCDLKNALNEHKSGYLALLGTPGSGKSTTLTHTLRYQTSYRLVRYYAYIPDSPYQSRGEANNFLHDLVFALQALGFRGGSGQAKSNEELLDKFSQQLIELHESWLSDKVVTVILVDGLDHIEREQKTTRSLLEVLPHPSTLLEGVVFVLGSQTLELKNLQLPIKAQLDDSTRVLTMRHLAREQVFAMLDKAGFSTLMTVAQKEHAYRLSDGHPLAASYLIEKILPDATGSESIENALKTVNPYQGHVEQDYAIYWQTIENNTLLTDLLALLARLRISFNPLELEQWVNKATVKALVRDAGFYFYKDTRHSWRFFHNSFRQFILNRTSLNVLNEYDEAKNRDCHVKLSNLLQSGKNESLRSETLYHLSCAEKWDDVLKLATQKYFRNQFYALRPLADIKEDISFALRAARAMHDGVAVFRYLLIEHELTERSQVLEQIDMPEWHLALYGTDVAMDYLLHRNRLRVSQAVALKSCLRLIAQNELKAAQRLFEAAEPLGLLNGSEAIGRHGASQTSLLKQWIRCAHHFRTLEQIQTAIAALRVEAPKHASEEPASDLKASIQAQLRGVLVAYVSKFPDSDKWAALRTVSIDLDEQVSHSLQLDFNICNLHPKHPEAQTALDRILTWGSQNEVDQLDKVLIAEYLMKLRGDVKSAKTWIEGIAQPAGYEWSSRDLKHLNSFEMRIRLNRVLTELGEGADPIKAVPDSDDQRSHGNVLFERQLVTISNIWGKAKNGTVLPPSEIIRTLNPALRLFNRNHSETREWSSWYQLVSVAPDYFDLMIRAVTAHSAEALSAIGEAFDQQWSHEKTKMFWPTQRRLRIALTLYRHGGNRDAFIRRLSSLENEIGVWHDVSERVEEYGLLAMAWCEVRQTERGRLLIPKLLESSFGINHRKDRQLQQWVDVLTKFATYQPAMAQVDIARFSTAVVVLEKAGRGRGTQDAATELLALAMNLNPSYSNTLFNWLLKQGGIHFSTAVSGLLLGALRNEPPPLEAIFVIARRLLIPFTPHVYEPLMKQLASQTARYVKSEVAKHLLTELAQAIQVKAYPSERPRLWRAIIAGLREAGQDSKFIEELLTENPGEQDSTSASLLLKDGRKLTEDEVIVLVNSFEGLAQLIASIEKSEYFPWQRVIKPIIGRFTAQQARDLIPLFEPLGQIDLVRNMSASRLHDLGHTNEAMPLLEIILADTTASGWDSNWDGGSKQHALKALIAIAPDEWRPRAMESLITDYLSEFRYPVNLLYNLEELVEILFKNAPWEPLWTEISEHIYQLTDFSLAEDVAPEPCPSNQTVEQVLLEAVVWTGNLPIDEIRDQVHGAYCDFVSRDIAPIATRAVMSSLLSGEQPKVIQGLAVLDSTWQSGSDLAKEYSGQINALGGSPDFIVRGMVERLAEVLGLDTKIAHVATKQLPVIYSLDLPLISNEARAIPFDALRSHESYPDTKDSLEMIRPFEMDLKLLSRLTGVPFENLLHRTSELMRQLVPEEQWDQKAADAHLQLMKDADLSLRFNRLRPQVALRALSHVVGELADAGRMDCDGQKMLESRLRRFDWRLANKQPQIRSNAVMPFKGFSGNADEKAWLLQRSQAFDLFMKSVETGHLVAGELARFKAWDWSVPTEYRFSMACHPDWPFAKKPNNPSDFFYYESTWNACEYPYLENAGKYPTMVIYGHKHGVAIGSSEWLAFNPAFASQLGWLHSDEGLFRWVNDEGNTMAESIWWQDGPINRQPPRSSEVTGEGWLVVVSPAAQKSIVEHFQPIKFMRAVHRSVTGDNKPLNGFSVDRVEWPCSD